MANNPPFQCFSIPLLKGVQHVQSSVPKSTAREFEFIDSWFIGNKQCWVFKDSMDKRYKMHCNDGWADLDYFIWQYKQIYIKLSYMLFPTAN